MAKILIIYHSETGNTEAMSESVEAGVKREGVEVVRTKIEEASVDDLLEADGVIIGSPTHFAAVSAEVKGFIDESIKHYGKHLGQGLPSLSNDWRQGDAREQCYHIDMKGGDRES